jgi:hypothetical protein
MVGGEDWRVLEEKGEKEKKASFPPTILDICF